MFHPPTSTCPPGHLSRAPTHLGPHRWTRCQLSSPIPYPSPPLLPHPENLKDPQGPYPSHHSCLPQGSTCLLSINAKAHPLPKWMPGTNPRGSAPLPRLPRTWPPSPKHLHHLGKNRSMPIPIPAFPTHDMATYTPCHILPPQTIRSLPHQGASKTIRRTSIQNVPTHRDSHSPPGGRPTHHNVPTREGSLYPDCLVYRTSPLSLHLNNPRSNMDLQ
uniref:Protein 28 xII n=1 Tax=Human T-cell leukemia virus 2 TaxID=11909 RepID=Q80824_HTLV2|nr:protein 28 xII [Human T-lymphotropic virus 2]